MGKADGFLSIEEAVKKGDYAPWFKDLYVKDYLSFLQASFPYSSPEGRIAILEQISALVVMYSVLVYKTYYYLPEFKERVDSDKRLKNNFKMVKEWLDRNEGKKIADEYFRVMESQLS